MKKVRAVIAAVNESQAITRLRFGEKPGSLLPNSTDDACGHAIRRLERHRGYSHGGFDNSRRGVEAEEP